MDECEEVIANDILYEVIDVKNLHSSVRIEDLTDEDIIFSMTSLNTFLLLSQTDSRTTLTNSSDENDERARLSLAYEKLRSIPKLILQELAPFIRILDISHNEFNNLMFLTEFKHLTSFICDHNNITCDTIIPYIPKLELLWMNNCKICELYPWSRRLQESCPNLKYLSLMGNGIAPSFLNGSNVYEYVQYRLFIISLFPKLVHLDDRTVTDDQREEAQRLYRRPILERIISKTAASVPTYLRVVSEKVSGFLSPAPFAVAKHKNVII